MRLSIFGIAGIGEIHAGNDVAAILIDALIASGERLEEGDVVVITSKIVSKAEGRMVSVEDREAHVASETVRSVAARKSASGGVTQIVESVAGPVMAGAGVDASNVPPGRLLLLPPDPDGSARALRARLRGQAGVGVGVIVSDTVGRPWRTGLSDFALGAAGVAVTEDLRGAGDTHGRPLRATLRALADEVAAGADLVKGKVTGTPIAVVRGLPAAMLTAEDGPGARALIRSAEHDWFRYGHVEAVRASLGIKPDEVEAPSVPADDVPARLARTLLMARPGERFRCRQEGSQALLDLLTPSPTSEDWVALGVLSQRISSAAWSEDLGTIVRLNGTTLTVTAVDGV